MMKYVDDKTSESTLFDELFDEVCEYFFKKRSAERMWNDKKVS